MDEYPCLLYVNKRSNKKSFHDLVLSFSNLLFDKPFFNVLINLSTTAA
jgi:hypothetical protein